MASSRVPHFLSITACLLLLAASIEAGTRALDLFRGRPWDATRSCAETRRFCDRFALEAAPRRIERLLQPYVGWELPATQRREGLEVEYYRSSGRSIFDVLLLGGDSARTFADRSSAALVALLQRDERLAGHGARLHDYACAGYKEPQASKLLAWLLALGHRPDAVLLVDGPADADLAWRNARAGANPGYPALETWAQPGRGLSSDWGMADRLYEVLERRTAAKAFGEWFLHSGLWHSAFLDHVASLRLAALGRGAEESALRLRAYAQGRRSSPELEGPAFATDEAALDDSVLATWIRAARNVDGMCEAQRIPFVHVVDVAADVSASRPASDPAGRILPRLLASGLPIVRGPLEGEEELAPVAAALLARWKP